MKTFKDFEAAPTGLPNHLLQRLNRIDLLDRLILLGLEFLLHGSDVNEDPANLHRTILQDPGGERGSVEHDLSVDNLVYWFALHVEM